MKILPRLLPEDLDTLEYRLINLIYKLARDTQPVVALVAPRDPQHSPYMRQLYANGTSSAAGRRSYETLERLLRVEKYDVRRIDLSQQSGLPPEATTIIVVNPRPTPSVNAGNSAARCMRAKPFFWRCRTIAGTTT